MTRRLLFLALFVAAAALALAMPSAHASSNVNWFITVHNIEARVGEEVEVVAAATGNGGLPAYTLRLAEPQYLSLDSPAKQTAPGSLGIGVSWQLTALHPGVQQFDIYLYYEKTFCSDDLPPPGCVFTFVSTTSQTLSIIVHAGHGDADCDEHVTSIDAALVLQLNAALLDALPCDLGFDPNGDDAWDALDAALILQFVSGLLPHFV